METLVGVALLVLVVDRVICSLIRLVETLKVPSK